ncbi:MAG: 2-hydroxyacyl-CoA dehydratase [Armatimonadetes bacterium]|nr:2-hydroxyacyl-CoA dehydratase [Armatimonadota bacterium]
MKHVGITTTIPVEAVYAAGCVPVDLNNIFITADNAPELVAEAEYQGYPRNACGWIKGIYSVAARGDVDALIAVVEGDCSQTQAMVETLQLRGLEIIPFAFPYGRDRDLLSMQIDKLITRLGTIWDEAERWKTRLDKIRRKVWRLDELTWSRGTLTSFENHYFQVNCSDFNRAPDAFEAEVDAKLAQAECETPRDTGLKIGYIGVPPIFTDFYDYLESLGVRVVFNEVQRQFSMPFETDNLVDQYARYTYPYDVFARIDDIKREVSRRGLHGLIHYTQSFCFRQIQDLIIRKQIDIPILTLEGDSPAKLDARTKVRIESFIEMLS